MAYEPIIVEKVDPVVEVANQHTPGRLILDIDGKGFASTRITLVSNIGLPTDKEEYGFPLMDVFGRQEVWSGTLGSLLDPESGNGITNPPDAFIAFYASMYPLFMQTVQDLVNSRKVVLEQSNKIE